jgi:Ca2+-binding EF-hand superfamily protein
MNRIFFTGAALAALAATAAVAQPEGGRFRHAEPLTRAAVQAQVQARFAEVDSDRDGFVTEAEARARVDARRAERREQNGERRAARFARLDANGDGSISRAEFDARPAIRGEDRGERREARGDRRERRRGHRAGRRGHGGMGMAHFGLRRFAALDGDRDGRVSMAEASARALAMFDRADANRDGTVTAEERRAAREAFRGPRRERRGS